MKRNTLPAVLLAVFLFSCGVLVGALGHRYYRPSIVVAGSPERFRQPYITEMKSRLALTADQVVQLQGILDDTKAEIKVIRERNHPEMVKIKEEQISRVKAILKPQQIQPYQKLVEERDRRYREQEDKDRQEELKRNKQQTR